MNIKLSNKDIVVALVAGFVGATISSTMMPSDGYASIRRLENGSVTREINSQLLEQERRVARLRALQEEELLYGSAPEEEDGNAFYESDARDHYRAYRHCTFRGYTRTRLHSCIEEVLEFGSYEPSY
ncbi:hypothetical protein H6770_00120 [Candidatus Peribacteria bacterium]|nr:hypothetical protein [Candidatus Peribacteria bacterium]